MNFKAWESDENFQAAEIKIPPQKKQQPPGLRLLPDAYVWEKICKKEQREPFSFCVVREPELPAPTPGSQRKQNAQLPKETIKNFCGDGVFFVYWVISFFFQQKHWKKINKTNQRFCRA
jgi:hypothetical protein